MGLYPVCMTSSKLCSATCRERCRCEWERRPDPGSRMVRLAEVPSACRLRAFARLMQRGELDECELPAVLALALAPGDASCLVA